MTIQLTTLANGFRVLTDHLPHLGTVTSGVWVGVGARNERPAVNGIAHFLEHMIFKGTESRDALGIALEIENRGGEFNAYTDYDVTAYYTQMAAKHVDVSCEIIGDIVLNSVFPEEEVEKERGVVIQEIGRYADEPEDVVYEALRRTAFDGQALGRPILGRRRMSRASGGSICSTMCPITTRAAWSMWCPATSITAPWCAGRRRCSAI